MATTYTYDLATTVGKLRLLAQDTDGIEQQAASFCDEEIAWAYAQEGNSLYAGAALLLEMLASNRSKLAVRLSRGPVTEDLTQVADNLRKSAALLRQQADDEDGTGALQAIISPSYDRFSHQRNIDQGRHGNGPWDYEGNVDTVVVP
jgi:hypothetical protein